jgi:predicted SAM-dependent methyltransferase
MYKIDDPHSLFSKQYLPTWKYLLRFEIISFIGRIFFQKTPPKVNNVNLLNLGCGLTYFDDWVNADFFRVRFWVVPKNGWSCDFRYPMKCKSNYWDGIFTEHTIEHLHPLDDYNLFKELFRTLKPGCWLRISVPSLDKILEEKTLDNEEEYNLRRRDYSSRAEMIWSLTQNWGHLSVWDSELLPKFLKDVGFVNVKEVKFGVGTDSRLIKEQSERKHESLFIEAQKPI